MYSPITLETRLMFTTVMNTLVLPKHGDIIQNKLHLRCLWVGPDKIQDVGMVQFPMSEFESLALHFVNAHGSKP